VQGNVPPVLVSFNPEPYFIAEYQEYLPKDTSCARFGAYQIDLQAVIIPSDIQS